MANQNLIAKMLEENPILLEEIRELERTEFRFLDTVLNARASFERSNREEARN